MREIYDIEDCDIYWYGIDKNGYIFYCSSAGISNVPKFVGKDFVNESKEPRFLDDFFLYTFEPLNLENKKYIDEIDEDRLSNELEKIKIKLILDPYLASDAHLVLALKGITSFDALIEYLDSKHKKEFNAHKYEYKKITQPTELLHFDQLPENVQKIMDSHRVDVDIQKDDYFFIESIY